MIKQIKRQIKRIIRILWRAFFANNTLINKGLQRFLLIYPAGIGNTILANSALKSIKVAYPRAWISAFYMQNPTKEILSLLQSFNEIIYLKSKMGKDEERQTIKFLKGRKFDAVIIFFPNVSSRIRLLLFAARIPIRIGFNMQDFSLSDGFSNVFLTHAYNYDFHESEFQNSIDLLKYFNVPEIRSINFQVRKCDVLRIDEGKLRLGIHVGRFNNVKPGWSRDNFKELINLIKDQNTNIDIYVFGGIEENDNREYFLERIPEKINNLIGRLSLEQTVYYISRMNLFLSNDTGLMHIAASQGIPLLAIFGPTDQIKNRPIIDNESKLNLINKKLPCSPCYPRAPLRFCKGRVDCLNLISPEEILMTINYKMTGCEV